MTLENLQVFATIVAAPVALLVFTANAWSHSRNRKIESLARFDAVRQRSFVPNIFIANDLQAFETGTMERDLDDFRVDVEFQLMLLEIERLAILANNKAVGSRKRRRGFLHRR